MGGIQQLLDIAYDTFLEDEEFRVRRLLRPLYADYALFGPFQWARCISPFELLEKDDPVRLWHHRLLDRFDGLARKSPAYEV